MKRSIDQDTSLKRIKVDGAHAINIVQQLLYDTTKKCDRIILVAESDGAKFMIHSTILMAASGYYNALLRSNFECDNRDEYIVRDVDGAILQQLVEFCYTGNIDINDDNIEILLEIASFLQMDMLETQCLVYRIGDLRLENAVEVLVLADKLDKKELRTEALRLVCGNLDNILIRDRIEELGTGLMRAILDMDYMVALESDLFKCLLRWSGDYIERKVQLPELLLKIRLEYISSEFLNSDEVHVVYGENNLFHHLFDEYKRRILNHNAVVERRGLLAYEIYCTYYEELKNGSYVIVKGFNPENKIFDTIARINVGKHKDFTTLIHGFKVYILGGVEGDNIAFDMKTMQTTKLAPMYHIHHFAAVGVYGSKIYVFGGQTQYSEIYNIEYNSWRVVDDVVDRDFSSALKISSGFFLTGIDDDLGDIPTGFDIVTSKFFEMDPYINKKRKSVMVKSNDIIYSIGGGNDAIDSMTDDDEDWDHHAIMFRSGEIVSAIDFQDKVYAITRFGNLYELDLPNNIYKLMGKMDGKYYRDYKLSIATMD